MKPIEEVNKERILASNALFEVEQKFLGFVSEDFLLLLKFRDRVVGKDKQVFDQSKWVDLTRRDGVTIENATTFIDHYEALQDIVARCGKRRSVKMAERLKAMHAAVTFFLEKAPALFDDIEVFVNSFSLAGYAMQPAFEADREQFEKSLRRTQESDPRGNLARIREKLDGLGFLPYVS